MAQTRRPSATIIAVAKRAQVSPSTVSRVMNGNDRVDIAIVQRVREAVATLGYKPNQRARSLVLGRTGTIAILVPDLANPTFQGILSGLTRAAARSGYRVVVADSIETVGDESELAMELRSSTDGIVLCAPRMSDIDLRTVLPSLEPVVVINRDRAVIDVPVLAADFHAGILALAGHLHDLGHRRIAFLQGPTGSQSNGARLRGLRAFTDDHPEVSLTTIECGATFERGYAAVDALLETGVTACLAFNDLVAMGVVTALRDREVAVPQQLSVTGFDDIVLARAMNPSLTTAAVPVEELGQESWTRLAAVIEGRTPPPNLIVTPELRLRGSTAPASA